VLLHHGRVLADGRPADITGRLPGAVVEVTPGDRTAAFDALDADPGIADVAVFGIALHARVDTPADVATNRVRRILSAAGVDAEVRAVQPTLEDAFLHLTAHDGQLAEAT
jgi:ABC-2 type transport system ATP-binding protein